MHKLKYQEDKYLAEMWDYITQTYGSHYAGEDGIQTLDLIISTGRGEGFCVGSGLKYLSRYGRKGTRAESRKDLMKTLHFTMIMLFLHDREDSREE
jgi:hypothetical protein